MQGRCDDLMISNWIYGIGIWVGYLDLCDKYVPLKEDFAVAS